MRTAANVSDEELAVRSIMMRVYHSRINGEAFYPERFVNGEAPELEANGWIERHGGGWRMTEDGVKAWAEMSLPVMQTNFRLGSQNELLHSVGRPIMRVSMNKKKKAILRTLVENGGAIRLDVLHDQFGKGIQLEAGVNGLKSLMNGVYLISDGVTVQLTDVGWMVVREMKGHEEWITKMDLKSP